MDAEMLKRHITLEQPTLVDWDQKLASQITFGPLEKLPMELIFEIFSQTSISDLLNLYRTNSRAKALIDSWPVFSTVNRYGANAVRALIATRLAHSRTYSELEDVVFSSQCEVCQEHGEIVYLLKLKRCCMKCLSTERELHAVHTHWAKWRMGVTQADMDKLPILRSRPQADHFNTPLAGNAKFVDWTSAVALGKNTVKQRYTIPSPRIGWAEVLDKSLNLDARYISFREAPEKNLQQRRQAQNKLAPLTLPGHITVPQEIMAGQHACSVYLPAMSRKGVRTKTESRQPEYHAIKASHCAGCAHYWNYHSTIPLAYHAMYATNIRQSPTAANMTPPPSPDTPCPSFQSPSFKHSAFAHHVKHCIYAHLYWYKLFPRNHADIYSPTYASTFRDAPQFFIQKHNKNHARFRRFGSSDKHTNAQMFEYIPFDTQSLFEELKDDNPAAYAEPTIWPASPLTLTSDKYLEGETGKQGNNAFISVPACVKTEIGDSYGDMLFQGEAVSQATWATANMHSKVDLVSLFRHCPPAT